MTRKEIEARLKALAQYEMALISSMPDEGSLTDRELTKILLAKSQLRKLLDGVGDQLGIGISPQASATAPAKITND